MPRGPIPDRFHRLLDSPVLAFVSTIGRHGRPQISPIWFLFDGQHVLLSLIAAKQKYRNLMRDPRIAIAFNDPSRPTTYLEIRGHADISPDPGDAVFARISRKYTGRVVSLEPPETRRFVARIQVESYTFQDPVEFTAPATSTSAPRD